MLSKLTLIGLHQYSEGHLFDNLVLPTGLDNEIVVNEILRLGGEFSTVYPDLEFMEYQIDIFSKKWYHNFERWYDVYTEEYKPLFNVDVKTSIEEQGHNQEDSAKAGNTSGLSNTNTSHNSSGNSSGNNTTTTQKAAYDSGTFQNVEKVIADSSLSSSEAGSEASSNTTSSTNSESLTAEQYHTVLTEEYKRGNFGMTMSQEMLLAEYNAWYQNLYIMIAEVFVNEFCVCIYK